MGGRKAEPVEVHQVKGTFRKDRHGEKAEASDKIPRPPAYLTTRQKQIFNGLVNRLRAINIASDSHTEMLCQLAIRLDEVEACSKVINEQGMTYTTRNVAGELVIKNRPEVAQRNVSMRHAQSLLVEFGLSPAARSKVPNAKTKALTGGWDDL